MNVFVTSLKDKLKELFTLDLRSLALMRIGTGVVVVIDLIDRLKDINVFYNASGVTPYSAPTGGIFFHVFNLLWKNQALEILVFFIAFLLAISLILGFKSKLSTILLLLIEILLVNQNNYVFFGVDTFIQTTLFWGIFLPWDRWFSVKRTDKTIPTKVITSAGIAYLFQLALIYFVASLLKSGYVWTDGTAVAYTLMSWFGDPAVAPLLLNYPALTTMLTYSTLVIQHAFPILLFFPLKNWVFRTLAILSVIGMQIGINVSMVLGVFGTIATVMLIGALPTELVDLILRRKKPAHQNVTVSVSPPTLLIFLLILAFVLLINVQTLTPLKGKVLLPDIVFFFTSKTAAINQNLGFFSPNPATRQYSVAAPLLLDGGNTVDAMTDTSYDAERFDPQDIGRKFSNRWIKYFDIIAGLKVELYWKPFALYLCNEWNKNNDQQAATAQVILAERLISLDPSFTFKTQKTSFGPYECKN